VFSFERNSPLTDTKKAASIDSSYGPVSVALALLERQWPVDPAIISMAGGSSSRTSNCIALETNPRYLIGRFQQAIATLLDADLPPMDTLTALLAEAIADAISWRQHDDRPCPDCVQSLCASCLADWEHADRYHALARALGAVCDPRLVTSKPEDELA
jgi:hypothetical protein